MPHARPLTDLTFEVIVNFFSSQSVAADHEWRQHVHLAACSRAGYPIGNVFSTMTVFCCDGNGIFGGADGRPFFISNQLTYPDALLVRRVKLEINNLDGFDAAHRGYTFSVFGLGSAAVNS